MQPKSKGSPRSTEYSHIAADRLRGPRGKAAREVPSSLVSTTPPPSEPEIESTQTLYAARYERDQRIGRGGTSEVWSAYDRKLGVRVALKIITLECEDPVRARARFEREASLSGQLRGAHFVEVFGHGVVDATAYIAMTLLEGETLHERLRRRRRLSPSECRELLTGIAGGLRLAHALQVIHRDLKPGNIFFARPTPKASGSRTKRELGEVVKLLDFGIAKDAWDGANLTRRGMVLGSASYMSPEHILCGPDIDARADLWSLGVVLYRALTGELPFPGRLAAAIVAIQTEEPRAATFVNPALPNSADKFFEQALCKDRSGRFQTIDELVRAFQFAFPMPEDTEAEITRPPPVDVPERWSLESFDLDSSEWTTGAHARPSPAPQTPIEPRRAQARTLEVTKLVAEQPIPKGLPRSIEPVARRASVLEQSPPPPPFRRSAASMPRSHQTRVERRRLSPKVVVALGCVIAILVTAALLRLLLSILARS